MFLPGKACILLFTFVAVGLVFTPQARARLSYKIRTSSSRPTAPELPIRVRFTAFRDQRL